MVFRDLNLALTNCTLPNRAVRLNQNTPPQAYTVRINPQFTVNDSACNSSLGVVVELFGEANTTVPVTILGCNHSLEKCRLSVQNIVFADNCAGQYPTWNQYVTDPAPTPILLELLNNTFMGQGSLNNAIAGYGDNNMVIGEQGPGTGKQTFYIALQKGIALAEGYGNTFIEYGGPRVVNITGRNCNVTVNVGFNTWNECPANCITVSNVGGIAFDYNTIENSGGNNLSENAAVHIQVCQPTKHVPYELIARYNQFTLSSDYAPPYENISGGYITAFWFDPVPSNYMSVTIQQNKGNSLGVCMRQDDRPNNSPFTDPQALARSIDLQNKNLFCKGKHYDVRLNGGPSYDKVVDSDQVMWRGFFCNNGCPKTNETQLGIVMGIIAFMVAIVGVYGIYALLTTCQTQTYFSGVYNAWIPRNPLSWGSHRIIPGSSANGVFANQAENKRQRVMRNYQV